MPRTAASPASALFALTPAALAACFAFDASAQTFTWDDTTGDNLWFTDGNWDLAGVPNGAGDSAIVGSPSPTLLNGFATLDSLTVTSDGVLTMLSGSDFGLNGNVANDGTITLDGTGSATEFRVDASLSLTGTGELVIGPGGVNVGVNLIGDDGPSGNTLTNGADHTIRALGIATLGRGTTGLVNEGLISSTGGGDATIDTNSVGFSNFGTLEAINGGTVRVASGDLTNVTGPASLLEGTFRAVDGTLNVTPGGFDLGVNILSTLDFAGSYETDLFDEANSTPGAAVSQAYAENAGTLILRDGADLTTNAAGGFVNNDTLFVGAGSTFSVTAGTLDNEFSFIPVIAGAGTIDASVNNGPDGIIAPGDLPDPSVYTVDISTLSITGDLTLSQGLVFDGVEIDIAGSGDDDLITVGGALVLAGALEVDLLTSFTPADGEQFLIATATPGQITGAFSVLDDDSALYDFTQVIDNAGGQVFLQASLIPEPGTAALALAGLTLLARRRQSWG